MPRCPLTPFVCGALLFQASLTCATGPEPRALITPVTVDWMGLPLRHVAARLSELGGVAVVIDRRLDPGTSVTLHASAESLADVLARVADAAQGEMTVYAGHARLVPCGGGAALVAAERLRAEELRTLGKAIDVIVEKKHAWSWPDGARPRDLVASAAAEAGIVIDGLDALPHDHFPAARLPALTLADRLDLLLAHFDRRIEWRPRPGVRGAQPVFAIVDLPRGDPTASTGMQRPPRRQPQPPRSAPPTASTYTLTVAAPLEELLATLARRFGLTLELDRSGLARAGVAPAKIVRLELKDVSREHLLDAICAPRGLTWRIEGDTLAISAASR